MLRINTQNASFSVSAVKEQKALRRAETRIASAARSVRKLAAIGEELISKMEAENDPAAVELRRQYEVMVQCIDDLAQATRKTHDVAEAFCRKRGATIMHAGGGMPKEEQAQWLAGRSSSNTGKLGFTGA